MSRYLQLPNYTNNLLRLGFTAESSFEEIIRVHVEDELGGALPG